MPPRRPPDRVKLPNPSAPRPTTLDGLAAEMIAGLAHLATVDDRGAPRLGLTAWCEGEGNMLAMIEHRGFSELFEVSVSPDDIRPLELLVAELRGELEPLG